MSNQVVNTKSVILAGAALSVGLSLGAVQQQTSNTVSAVTTDNTSSQKQSEIVEQTQTDLKDIQTKYDQQKAVVSSAQQNLDTVQESATSTSENLSQAKQKLNELQQNGDLDQTQTQIASQQKVVAQNKTTATQAQTAATEHQQELDKQNQDYDQTKNAVTEQQSKTTAAKKLATTAQIKIDNTKKDQLTKEQTLAQNKVDQDQKDLNQTSDQTKKEQSAVDDLSQKLSSTTASSSAVTEDLKKADEANQVAQKAKSEQQTKVTQAQLAYDQVYGKHGKMADLKTKIDDNVQYKNLVHLPYTLDQLRKADNQETDDGWDEIVHASENAYHAPENQFQSENKDEDSEVVDPRKLTPIQERQLSEYTMRIINNARQQLNLPIWTYGVNTQSLADDIAADYDEHHRSNRQGHYVEGIVREANKHGLKIDANYIEDMYAFYAPLDKPITMTEAKENLYDNLKGMLLGNVCNPGSDPEYHHANSFLGDDPASYALSLSNQKEDDHDFVTTHFINVTSGHKDMGNGVTVYTGITDVSQRNGGTWQKDADADTEIKNQIASLDKQQDKQLANLNALKDKLTDLTNKAMNTEISYTNTKTRFDQLQKAVKDIKTNLAANQHALVTNQQKLSALKKQVKVDNDKLSAAKDDLVKFNAEQQPLIKDYQRKEESYQKEQAALNELLAKSKKQKQLLDEMTAKQKQLVDFAKQADKAVELAQKVLQQKQQHQGELKDAISTISTLQSKLNKQNDLVAEGRKKVSSEQAKLSKLATAKKDAQRNLETMQQMQQIAEEEARLKKNEEKQKEVKKLDKEKEEPTEDMKGEKVEEVKAVKTSKINKPDTTKPVTTAHHNSIAPAKGVIKKPVLILDQNGQEVAEQGSNENKTKESKLIYLPIINHNNNWQVNLYDAQGQKTDQKIFTNSYWRILAKKEINSQLYYCIFGNLWVPANMVKQIEQLPNSQVVEHQFLGIVYLVDDEGLIPLLDQNGNFTGKFVDAGTAWKVWAIKWVDGQEMLRLGTENQWISIKYVKEFQLIND